MLFCPYTPGSSLKKKLQKTEDLIMGDSEVCRVREVERGGPTIGAILSNKVFWKSEKCQRQLCRPCVTKPGSCRKSNFVYRVRCLECAKGGQKSHYIGESHRTLVDRSRDHEKDIRSSITTNAMVRHWKDVHNDSKSPPNYSYEVVAQFRSSLQRQLMEALLIEREKCDTILNGKGEWGINLVPRLTVEDESEFKRVKVLNRTDKRDRAKTDETETETDFNSQLSQRRKRKKLESQVPEGEAQTNVSTSISQARKDEPLTPPENGKVGTRLQADSQLNRACFDKVNVNLKLRKDPNSANQRGNSGQNQSKGLPKLNIKPIDPGLNPGENLDLQANL